MKTFFLTLAICFIGLVSAFGQSEYLYNYMHGLSNSLIDNVYIDNDGMLWVSTQEGLNVFNGNKFKRVDIPDLYFNHVMQLHNGTFMIATNKGLWRFNLATDNIQEVPFYNSGKRSAPFVTHMSESDTVLYITTSGFGLYTLCPHDTTPQLCPVNSILKTKFLQTVFVDSRHRVWVSSFGKDSYVFDQDLQAIDIPQLPDDISQFEEDYEGNIYAAGHKDGIARISFDLSVSRVGPRIPVSSLYADGYNLYIGSDGLGLGVMDIHTGEFSNVVSNDISFDFSKSKIHSIQKDKLGNLWLGVYQKGLMLITKKSAIFDNYGYIVNSPNSIGSNSVGALELVGGDIWIGTEGDGIYIIGSDKKVTHLDVKDTGGHTLLCNIVSMYNQDGKYMWIGTYNSGFIKLDIPTRKTQKIFHSKCDKVSKIAVDHSGNMWYTSYGGGVGLFDTKKEEFVPGIVKNPSWANSLVADKYDNIWIATYDGVLFTNKDKTFSRYYTVENNYVPDNAINTIATDSRNCIWAGTNSGVLVLNPTNGEKKYLLSGKAINSIIQDRQGYVWISTLDGLYRYDIYNDKLLSFRVADGLLGNEFTRGASVIGPDGMAWFGGISGVTHIMTDNLTDSVNVGNVVINSLVANNKDIHVGDIIDNVPVLRKTLTVSDTIFLPESANNFTLNFCTSNPANYAQTTFKVRMLGFDKDFVPCVSGISQATYTNLKNGTYTFEVLAMIGDNVSPTRRLTIIIYPHWYKTWGARTLFALFVLLLLFFVWEYFKEKLRHRQSEQINEMKMQFFINISHEIRTPLTLIIDPLEKLLGRKNSEEERRYLYKTMQVNSKRILRLVSQLLDLRKIDKGQVMMKFGKTEICSFINYIVDSCHPIVESKEINLTVTNNHNGEIYAWIDPENFEKVILNLISNAVKFTPVGGEIGIDISEDDDNQLITISVTDNGIGISIDEIGKIFQRFYQVKSAQTRYTTGTGVGLHLSKYLTELHKGRLYVENRTDKQGCRFVVELRMGNSHLPKSDLIDEETLITPPLRPRLENKQVEEGRKEDKKPGGKPKVFVVDDEDAIRVYLSEQLSAHYDVVPFPNGKAAMDSVLTEKPDLIISDIMMPEMDGWTFCKKLKRDFHTNHIPVILLTALTSDDDKSLGIEIGADMYMEKPFNTEFLLKAVKNLIENRKKVVDKAENKAENFNIENIQMKSQDEILMQKVMQIIKDKISCRDLNVEMLADTIGISRVHLHRKIKEITGLTARDFLKNIRMKQASYLLTDKNLTISEVAYAVGYSNPAHFSSSFKAFYGISPLAYSQREKSEKEEGTDS